MAAEIWLHGFPLPRRTVDLAVQAERWGFDGLLLADSGNLVGDPYVELALASLSTERLRLGPGVTNPLTRRPAVTAAAVATLQVESDGRAALVFGRGDSAVLQLGQQPATSAELERGVTQLQGLVPPRRECRPRERVPGSDELDLDHAPEEGPGRRGGVRTSDDCGRGAARRRGDLHGGRGSAPDSWAVGEARRAEAGRDAAALGAFVNVAVHPDVAVARDLVRGSAAIFVHYASEGRATYGRWRTAR